MPLSFLSYQTSGLFPNLPGNFTPIVAGGAPTLINPPVIVNPSEDPASYALKDRLNLTPSQIQSIIQFKNPAGSIIIPSQSGLIEVGEGYQLSFDPTTLQGRITPALANNELQLQKDLLADATMSYTGADVRLMIESAETPADGRRYAKQLLEATTITVSTYREICPVRASGYINSKGFALGRRTIAGTLIVTQFTAEVLLRFLQGIMLNDGSKDTTFTKVDQLPPFNITMIFTNELGYASTRRLLGVKFVTDGVVYSIQDMLVEQTLSWMALDFTPLLPLTLTNLYHPVDPTARQTLREKRPTDLMRQV